MISKVKGTSFPQLTSQINCTQEIVKMSYIFSFYFVSSALLNLDLFSILLWLSECINIFYFHFPVWLVNSSHPVGGPLSWDLIHYRFCIKGRVEA